MFQEQFFSVFTFRTFMMRVICLMWSFVCVQMSKGGAHRMGNKANLAQGLGINGCTAKDRKNKVKIDKARGWSEVEKIKGK